MSQRDHDVIGNTLLYHVMPGTVLPAQISAAPDHTVQRTFLKDTSMDQLEGGKPQAIVLTTVNNNTQPALQVLNQKAQTTALSTIVYKNVCPPYLWTLKIPPVLTNIL